MTVTVEELAEMETVSKRFRISSDQAAELRGDQHQDQAGEELTVTWQRVTDRAPSVLVTVPVGEDAWALPVPHRPGWLVDLITAKAPGWWLK
ncbi:hypothetical protein GR925_25860 [Streptomyces sp. HUCO-GS316]|uniref:hypothetical protein n=1 Tax=Streptomyces sp. HUCO-GS316 TaxID=2692198 RepID=UPI00136EB5BF|nr:hypothetical protein [Streptomyces sp. HUCO-GS316]MXM66763.1 hypothetical protein [Streptomyces sp. HUCO-GS316]